MQDKSRTKAIDQTGPADAPHIAAIRVGIQAILERHANVPPPVTAYWVGDADAEAQFEADLQPNRAFAHAAAHARRALSALDQGDEDLARGFLAEARSFERIALADAVEKVAQERREQATKLSQAGIISGENRRDTANKNLDIIKRVTADLRRKHPNARRPQILDMLAAAVADKGLSYTRSTLDRLMPPKPLQ